MDRRILIDIGRQIILLIGQIVIFFLCIGYISYIYDVNILPDKNVAETFTVSSCQVVKKTLETKGRVVHRYRADFLVNYVVNGNTYQSISSGNGLDYAFTTNKASEEELLTEFDEGASYPCWYDPSRPQIVVLVLRHNWTSTFPLVVPSVISLIMLYYIFKTLFQYLEILIVKMRNR